MLQRYCYLLEGGLLLLLATFSHAFVPVGRWKRPQVSTLTGLIGTINFSTSDETLFSAPSNLEGKHFQLEELEDAEKCTTDILLNSDMTVTVGCTDGPLFSSSHGTWSESFDESQNRAVFEMKLSRRFIAGENSKDATSIGEFEYEVERTYNGLLTVVGGVLVMEGIILDVDEIFGSREVGFFNMMDTTEARVADSVQL